MVENGRKSSRRLDGSKKFRRSIRGSVTSKGKKGKKKSKEETHEEPLSPSTEATKSTSNETFDDGAAYVNELDEVSQVPSPQIKESERVTIVLLLIDPMSRRFQLLLLEFDTTKLTVADILRQIPYLPATDKSLRSQTFDYMCDIEGLEYEYDMRISNYVEGSTVIIAVPKADTKGSEHISNMAKLILHRSKIKEALKSAGVYPVIRDEDSSAPIKNISIKPMVKSVKPMAVSVPGPVSYENYESPYCRRYLIMGGLKRLLSGSKKLRRSIRGSVTSKGKKGKKKSKKKTHEEPRSPSTVATKSVSSETFDNEVVYANELAVVSQVPSAMTIESQIKESERVQEPLSDQITIVLLLIDPYFRRFQLLRLEFDTAKLTVADILRRIPYLPATGVSLRSQTFDYMCDIEGLEYEYDMRISNYVEGSTVIIAVPKADTKGSEHISNMAKPILHRSKIKEAIESPDAYLPKSLASEKVVQDEVSSAPIKNISIKPVVKSVQPIVVSVPVPVSSEYSESTNHASLIMGGVILATLQDQTNIPARKEAVQELNLKEIQQLNYTAKEVCQVDLNGGSNQALLCSS